MKPVNGACPDGYILVDGGEDGKSGGSCLRNPFIVTNNEKDGTHGYDKNALDYLSRYIKSYLSGLPDKFNEDKKAIYDRMFTGMVSGGSSTEVDPLVQAFFSGDKEKIENAINNAKHDYAKTHTIGTRKGYQNKNSTFNKGEYNLLNDEADRILREEDEAIPFAFDGVKPRSDSALKSYIPDEFQWSEEYKAQQQTPPAQPVIPPANPQGQVELMQQQAQQMPVPNEVSSRTQLPQMTGGIPEAEQQVGIKKEMPKQKIGRFQMLTNLFSGKTQTQSDPVVDNRLMPGGAGGGSGMGSFTPAQAIVPQVAPKQDIQPIFTELSSRAELPMTENPDLSEFKESANNIGLTPDTTLHKKDMGLFDLAGDFLKNLFTPGKKTTNSVEVDMGSQAVSNPGTYNIQPAGIVDNATTPQAYRRMFGGQPTGPVGTPELGGRAQIITDPSQTGRYTAGGKDLGYNPINIQQPEPSEYDQKLYMQLLQQMGQPITNADYYPDINNINKGNVSVGDMSAPVYAGSFGLPPMAAIDKLKTRDYIKSAIDKMDIDRGQDQAQVAFVPPEVRQVASMPRLGGEFEKEANQYVSEMEAEFGRDWRKYAPQSPKTWSLVNRWKGIENAFNVGYDKSSEYLKLYQENQKSDNKAFFPQEGLRAAKWLQTGVNETTEGLPIDVNEIGQLMNQFEVYNNFGTWADDAIKNTNIRSTFVKQIPEAVEIKVSQDPTGSTDAEYIEAKKKYGEFPNGYRGFLIEKQTEQISGETARALVDKWDTTNPGAWQQMKKSKSESKDSVLKRLYSEFQNYLGTEIKTEIFKTAPVRNTTFNFNSGSGTGDEQGVYFNTASKIPEIKDYLSTNMTAKNVDEAISNAFMFGDKKGSFKPDESYVGVKIPGHFELADKETATRPFSEYVFDPSGTGVMEKFTAKGMFGGTQDLPENLAPTSTKIKDVVITFGVPDPNSAGGYRIITKNAIRKGDKIPENAVPVMVRQDLLTFDIENYQKGLSEDEKTKNMKLLAFIGKDDKGAPRRKVTKTAYTIQPVTTELMRNYDNVVSKKIGKESSGSAVPQNMSGSVSTGSDEEPLVE